MVKNFLKSDNISIKKQVAQLWYSNILSNDKVLKNKEVGHVHAFMEMSSKYFIKRKK